MNCAACSKPRWVRLSSRTQGSACADDLGGELTSKRFPRIPLFLLDSDFLVTKTMDMNMRTVTLDHNGVLRDIDDRHINVDRLLFLRQRGEEVKIIDVFSGCDVTNSILSQHIAELS